MGKFRPAILLGAFSILLTASCQAQQAARDALAFLTRLQDALQMRNAGAYTALFASDGKWDGPFGQNAMGPLNIRTAVGEFLTEFGPLSIGRASRTSRHYNQTLIPV